MYYAVNVQLTIGDGITSKVRQLRRVEGTKESAQKLKQELLAVADGNFFGTSWHIDAAYVHLVPLREKFPKARKVLGQIADAFGWRAEAGEVIERWVAGEMRWYEAVRKTEGS